MYEEWEPIEEFPNYSVSSMGRVRNEDSGRILALAVNQRDVVYVGLVRGRTQYKRSVPLLVARAFLDPPVPDTFDTPIHLNGDPLDNRYENLMWRPRWFAVKYQQQFRNEEHPAVPKTIQEIKTGYRFRDSWVAARQYGLLDHEILTAIIHRTYVWPTYQIFRVVKK